MNAPLANSERQVAPDLTGIRRDHRERYEFAARLLGDHVRVLDLACGVGYGSSILAAAGHAVVGIDRSADAIAYARQHWADSGAGFLAAPAEALEFKPDEFDAVVCFETIEHLADPAPVLLNLRRAAPRLIASVPNESVFPFRCEANRFQGWAHHFRHYTREEFGALLRRCGWRVTAWLGQIDTSAAVEPDVEGRTLIAVCERGDLLAPVATRPAGPEVAPDHVAIIGLGPTCAEFFELTRRLGGVSAYCDEVWGINAIGDVLRCDRVFHMDDVRVQEIRASARPDSNIAAMVEWLKRHPGPIYTSIVRDGYPGLVPFPLEAVLNGDASGGNGGAPYFNSTVAYAIAFAVHIGVKKISLFGIDFTLANAHHAEKGRACCEFWLGIAAARGIEILIPEMSTLMDACAPAGERLYGYDCADVSLVDRPDGRVEVRLVDRPPPTADEIERRYDHSRHPNRIVEQETKPCAPK